MIRACRYQLHKSHIRFPTTSRDFCKGSFLQQQKWDYDVVVVGGGVVGAALACELARMPSFGGSRREDDSKLQNIRESSGDTDHRRDPRILVVESFAPPPVNEALEQSRPVDVRTYAMTPSSQNYLGRVGAWQPLEQAGRAASYQAMQVWSMHRRNHFVHFDAHNHGGGGDDGPCERLGTIVEHTALQSSLFEEMKRLHDAGLLELRCPSQVKRLEFDSSAVPGGAVPAKAAVLELLTGGDNGNNPSSSSTVTARLVVAADGAKSPTRAAAGLGTWGWDYGQKAVVATVDVGPRGLLVEGGGGAVALQRFLPSGPVALLPLWEKASTTAAATVEAEEAGEEETEPSPAAAAGAKTTTTTTRLASVIWSTTSAHAKHLCSLEEADFVRELNAALQSGSSSNQSQAAAGREPEEESPQPSDDDEKSAAPSSPLPFLRSLPSPPPLGLPRLPFGVDQSLKPLGDLIASALVPNTSSGALLPSSVLRNVSGLTSSVLEGVGSAVERAAVLTGERAFTPPPEVLGLASRRFGLDLSLRQAHSYVGWRVALVGDAAHTVHPMAGQGLNLGLGDASVLAATIEEALQAGLDIGDPQVLSSYEASRRGHNLAMMLSLDTLHRLFTDGTAATTATASDGQDEERTTVASSGGGGGPVWTVAALPTPLRGAAVALREAGLGAVNVLPPLKQALARVAMGK